MWKDKKGVNDISILAAIFSVFVLLGVMLPFIEAEFENQSSSVDVAGLEADVGQEIKGDINAISAFKILLSIVTMFFWTFGTLPFWLDSLFVVVRIIFIFIIARNVWVGGGG